MVLVTGSTGLLGRHLLLHLLKQGREITALYHKESSKSSLEKFYSVFFPGYLTLPGKLKWQCCDILDFENLRTSLEGVDEVYHCAAAVSFNRRDRENVMKVNVEGTANLVNLCQEMSVKAFCHVSSIASLGKPATKKEDIVEGDMREPSLITSVYSMSKYLAELEVWRAMEEGLNAVIVNPAVIIGPGDWRSGSPAIFRRMWEGLSFFTEGVNGFVDVRDVATIMTTLVEKKAFGQQFIAVSENISYRELFSEIAAGLNMRPPSWKATPFIAAMAWRLDAIRSVITGRESVITRESSKIALGKHYYSNQKIRRELGCEFIPVMESARETAMHFKRFNSGH